MKINATTRKIVPVGRRWTGAVGSICLLCLSSAAVGQNPPRAGGGQAVPQNPPSAPSTNAMLNPNAPFVFEGGRFSAFIEQVNQHFGVDLIKRATMEVSFDTQVPKMRVQARARNEYGNVGNLFESYNALAINGFPHLGKWFWHGGVSDGLPDILTLSPLRSPDGKTSAASKARAFSVKGISTEQQRLLQKTILEFAEWATVYNRRRNGGAEGEFSGQVSVNQDTQLMLAFGSESFLALVESVVVEYRKTQLPVVVPPPKTQPTDGKRP